MVFLIAEFERAAKIRKIAVYRFLISEPNETFQRGSGRPFATADVKN